MRREYRGYAQATQLTTQLGGSTSDLTIQCSGLSGNTAWPTGSGGPFYIIIDRGKASEEKILCVSRSGGTINVYNSGGVNGRASDGTPISAHSVNATVEHVFTATDADEANAHVNASTNVHGIANTANLVTLTGTQSLTNKTITGGTVNPTTLQQGGVSAVLTTDSRLSDTRTPTDNTVSTAKIQDSAVTAAKIATDAVTSAKILAGAVTTDKITAGWTSYTPTFGGNITPGNGTSVGRYIQIGKIVFFAATFTAGSTSSVGSAVAHTVTLPAVNANTTLNMASVQVSFYDDSAIQSYLGSGGISGATAYTFWGLGTKSVWSTTPFTPLQTGDVIRVAGWYLAA